MFRPAKITHPVVVNDGKPFDASKGFLTVRKTEDSCTNEDLELAQCIVIFQHAQALNPPIKVKQAVLDAIEKVPEAKFRVLEAGLLPTLFKKKVGCKTKKEGGKEWIYGKTYYYDSWVDDVEKELRIDYDYIQADCPLALQVLLGFTTEGVSKDD
jgi:hypothetical protein